MSDSIVEILPAPPPLGASVPVRRDAGPLLAWRRPMVASILIGVAYFLARPDSIVPPDIGAFSFAPAVKLPGDGRNTVRTVHADYGPNSGWISSVGAAVSLGDLANSGRADGCIFVDPRDNLVRYVRFRSDSSQPSGWKAEEIARLITPATETPSGDQNVAPMGSVIGDFDADGWPDVLVYYWGRLPVIFRNPRGSGEWAAYPLKAVDVGGDHQWFTNCVTQADVDGDGRPDLIIGNYFPANAQVLNSAHDAGSQEMQDSMSHAVNGGRLCVLLNASRPGNIEFRAAPIELLDEHGAIMAEGRKAEIIDGWTLALGAADLDGDFLPELYVANDFGPDHLFVNESSPGRVRFRIARGIPSFDVPKSKTLGRDSFKGMGVDFAQLTPAVTDSPPAILVSNIAEKWALLESHFAFVPTVAGRQAVNEALHRGVAPFRDASEALGVSRSGWGWDIKSADFDNDGNLEIVQALGFLKGEVNKWAYLQELATGNDYHLRHMAAWPYFRTAARTERARPDRRFPNDKLSGDSHLAFFARRDGQGAFSEIGAAIGFKDPMVSRGIAVGDINHDGLVDFVLANQWEESFVYFNRARNAGNFIGLRIVRQAGDNPAPPGLYSWTEFQARHWTATPVIGARVIVEKTSGELVATAMVDGGNGHSGRRPAEIHLGVGRIKPEEPLDVRIQWKPATPTHNGWTSFAGKLHAGVPGEGAEAGWWVIVVGDKTDAE